MGIEELKRQRDALLVALQMISTTDMDVRQCRNMARRAIAAAIPDSVGVAPGMGEIEEMNRATNKYYPMPSRVADRERARDDRVAFRFGWTEHAALVARSDSGAPA